MGAVGPGGTGRTGRCGKRSDFPRQARDYYPTPAKGLKPVIPFLRRDAIRDYAEICAGEDHLIRGLERSVLFGEVQAAGASPGC
jgi:hypothetical protein